MAQAELVILLIYPQVRQTFRINGRQPIACRADQVIRTIPVQHGEFFFMASTGE